ncbi:GGDEF domain-containing protein [Paenibacillus sp. 79R4]|nr:GGDEF domain-containing protein [Paenibacillus sp. 79R4]
MCYNSGQDCPLHHNLSRRDEALKSIIKRGITLRFTISLLVIAAILLTMLTSITSALQVNRTSLIDNYLNKNESYSKKLAFNTNELLTTMQENIAAIASISVRGNELNPQMIDDLYQANREYFNSIVIADADRVVQAYSPQDIGISIGDKLNSKQSKEAVILKNSFISEPYRTTNTDRLIILVSAPIVDHEGNYKGFVGGTIYLEEDNVLSTMLRKHFFGDGSYVYVVDKNGDLIFHSEQARVGQHIKNEAVETVISGQSGSRKITNTPGKIFLVGYAYEPKSSWGIVSQTPYEVINQPLRQLVQRMLLHAMPFLLLILVLAWWIASRIAKPLNTLAQFSDEAMLNPVSAPNVPDIHSYYYEVSLLSRSVKIALQSMNRDLTNLRHKVNIDGLTGLVNRRGFDSLIAEWIESKPSFILILFDIDHFKQVNDTYGHVVGDAVLRYLAQLMQQLLSNEDIAFRYGGEEFGILVRHGELDRAKALADRLRAQLASTISPTGQPITVSAGISSFPAHGQTAEELVMRADEALYDSKENGRNKTTVFMVKELQKLDR